MVRFAFIAFDFAMWEIFAPLAVGAASLSPGEHEDDFVAVITDALVDGAATSSHFMPSMLRDQIFDPRGAAGWRACGTCSPVARPFRGVS